MRSCDKERLEIIDFYINKIDYYIESIKCEFTKEDAKIFNEFLNEIKKGMRDFRGTWIDQKERVSSYGKK